MSVQSDSEHPSLGLLRKFVSRAQAASDGRPMILYFLRQPERIGQLVSEMLLLKGVYPPTDYQLFVAHPQHSPRSRHFSQDAYNIAMRDVTPLEARDALEDQVCYIDFRAPIPMATGGQPLTLILSSDTYLIREWTRKFPETGTPYPPLWLTDVEKQRGARLRRLFGFAPDQPVVVLHVREQGLLRLGYEVHRNADIANYESAIRLLTARGYAVVRIGDPLCKPLPFACDGVIDTPFLSSYDRIGDPYFASGCAFLVHNYSGPSMLATAFNRPTLAVNVVPQDQTTLTNEVVSYKACLSLRDRVPLGLGGIVRAGLMNATAEHYAAAGYETEENDADLICDAVAEMIERVEGRFAPSPALVEANAKLTAFGEQRHRANGEDPAHLLGYSLVGRFGRHSLSEAFLARYPGFMDEIGDDGSVASP